MQSMTHIPATHTATPSSDVLAKTKSLVQELVSLAKFAARFLGGRPLRAGTSPSGATWWRWAPDPKQPNPLQAATLSPQAAGPSPWVIRLRARITSWVDKVDPKRRALLAARLALLAAALLAWPLAGWPCAALLGLLDAFSVRCVRRAARATFSALTGLYAVLRAWSRWPYAYRSAARLVLLAASLGLIDPAWRGWTEGGAAALTASALTLAVVRRPRPATLTDADRYAPGLWPLLRDDLELPNTEERATWLHVPDDLSEADAKIRVLLPSAFRGTLGQREALNELVNSRLPGEWVSTWDFKSEHHAATWRHKPAPKPAPQCPDAVSFFDPEIQAAITACEVGEVVLGRDEHNAIIIRRLDGETPHWALSVGTGGGKSAFNAMVAAQLIAQGFHVIVVDVKRSSLAPLDGIPGVHIYNDPENPQDMREAIEWFKEEISARSYVKSKDSEREFPGLVLFIEESNEFADVSKEWWDDNRKTRSDEFGPAERAADPIWGEVASSARLGRFVRGNIIAAFQDLRDQALGGKGLRNLFRLKFMGNFNVNQWKNVIGTTPIPDSFDKAGRMMIVEGNSQMWIQTLFGEGDKLHAWAMEHRERQGFDPTAGLFGTPPERSPERLPYLLRNLSRDKAASGPQDAPGGAWGSETAGGSVTMDLGVTGDVTAPRDRFRLIPGQVDMEAPSRLAPPRLLTLAEAARELEAHGIEIKENTMRQHKSRRETTGFPIGIKVDGIEKFTLDQLLGFYEKRGKRA